MRKFSFVSWFGTIIFSLMFGIASASGEQLKIGVEGALAPFNYTDTSGKVVGFDVDLTNAILAKAGLSGQWVRQDWDGLIPGLIAGKFDIISATVSITDERKKRVDFTDPLYRTSIRFVGPKGMFADNEPKTLSGRRLGAQRATVSSAYLSSHYPDAEIVLYDTQDALRLDLTAGRIDALIADQIATAQSFLDKPEGVAFEFFGDAIKPDEGIGLVLPKGHDELKKKLDDAIAAVRADGTLDRISHKYFPGLDLQ